MASHTGTTWVGGCGWVGEGGGGGAGLQSRRVRAPNPPWCGMHSLCSCCSMWPFELHVRRMQPSSLLHARPRAHAPASMQWQRWGMAGGSMLHAMRGPCHVAKLTTQWQHYLDLAANDLFHCMQTDVNPLLADALCTVSLWGHVAASCRRLLQKPPRAMCTLALHQRMWRATGGTACT